MHQQGKPACKPGTYVQILPTSMYQHEVPGARVKVAGLTSPKVRSRSQPLETCKKGCSNPNAKAVLA